MTDNKTEAPVKRPRGNPNWVKGHACGNGQNPGGVVTDSKKNVRKALLKLMETKPGAKIPKAKNRAEEVAYKLWELAMVTDCGEKQKLARLKELIDRVDGRSAAAPEDREALANAGPKIMLLDPRLRPGGGEEE